MTGTLKIYSGRNRPDLTPIYRLFSDLLGVHVNVQKIYHLDVCPRVVAEKEDPQADLLLTNSQMMVEAVRPQDVFESCQTPAAEKLPDWLRAPDFGWLSFTAWPRVAMINRKTLPKPTQWPSRLEDLCEPRFADLIASSSMAEDTTVAQFSALRAVKGEAWVRDFLLRLTANGLRVFRSNKDTREALVRDGLSVSLANSSNVHVFQLDGNAVAEAWLDQEQGGIGTHLEAHTVAVLRGSHHPDEARAFVDFLLSVEIQEILARLFGETPVNPDARCGPVRPLEQISRMPATLAQVVHGIEATNDLLRELGFFVPKPADGPID